MVIDAGRCDLCCIGRHGVRPDQVGRGVVDSVHIVGCQNTGSVIPKLAALTKTVPPAPAAEEAGDTGNPGIVVVDEDAGTLVTPGTLDVVGAKVRIGDPTDPELGGLVLEMLVKGESVVQGQTYVVKITVLVIVMALFWIFQSPAIPCELNASRRSEMFFMVGTDVCRRR